MVAVAKLWAHAEVTTLNSPEKASGVVECEGAIAFYETWDREEILVHRDDQGAKIISDMVFCRNSQPNC